VIGVLALQGDIREHEAALDDVGATSRRVRRPDDLEGIDGIILPGGESTTLSLLLESSGLFEPLRHRLQHGLPAFGTCAGLVLLASSVLDGRPDQRSFGLLDCTVRRNGYGRQVASFETSLEVEGLGAAAPPDPLRAVFIRAPLVVSVGPDVEVLASLEAEGGDPPIPVLLRQDQVLASAFHPELTPDRRLHRAFVAQVAATA
jgi:pyridoxal 5'-phosphate synthase pdxT subunit